MSITDPIADMLTRIRNANSIHQDTVDIPASNIKIAIAKALKDEGFIQDFTTTPNNQQGILSIKLKFGPNRELVINNLKRISKPSRRIYSKCKDLPRVLGGLGCAIISTPQGILTDKQARKLNTGGEILAHVW